MKFPNKTMQDVKQRWKMLRPNHPEVPVGRRHWTKEEDDQLRTYVERFGDKNWRLIASYMHGRLPKQCRERWINHLKGGILKGKLDEEEWKIIVKWQSKLGNKWSAITKYLPGRSPNQIKNFWYGNTKQRDRSNRKRKAESKRSTADTEDEEFVVTSHSSPRSHEVASHSDENISNSPRKARKLNPPESEYKPSRRQNRRKTSTTAQEDQQEQYRPGLYPLDLPPVQPTDQAQFQTHYSFAPSSSNHQMHYDPYQFALLHQQQSQSRFEMLCKAASQQLETISFDPRLDAQTSEEPPASTTFVDPMGTLTWHTVDANGERAS